MQRERTLRAGCIFTLRQSVVNNLLSSLLEHLNRSHKAVRIASHGATRTNDDDETSVTQSRTTNFHTVRHIKLLTEN